MGFGDRSRRTSQLSAPEPAIDVEALHAKIGEFTLANDFFVRCGSRGRTIAERKVMVLQSGRYALVSKT